jgi:hypothetical protein
MTTELDLLAAARPPARTTPRDLVTPAARQELKNSIISTPRDIAPSRATSHPRRKWLLSGALVSAAAVAAVIVTGVLLPDNAPGGPSKAGAATLNRLAVTAAGGPTVGVGQFDFTWKVFAQKSADGVETSLQQLWTASTGEAWGYSDPGTTSKPAIAPFCIHRRAGAGDSDFDEPTPAFLATYPTNPDALNSFLRAHVHGSTSTDEAVFVAVGDMLRTQLPSPALRAAGFRVLAMTGHVRVTPDASDAKGRSTVRVDFTGRRGSTESLYFDPATSRITEEADSADGAFFARTVTVKTEVTNSVPRAVIACADSPKHHGLTRPPVH